MKFTFQGSIEKGHKLKLHQRNTFDRTLLAFKEGSLVTLTIATARKDRSLNQNSYYFGVVVKMLGDHFGYETDEMHTELKRLFNPKASRLTNGETYGGSTAKMSTVEFNDYLDRIVRWAATDHAFIIPDPNECEP